MNNLQKKEVLSLFSKAYQIWTNSFNFKKLHNLLGVSPRYDISVPNITLFASLQAKIKEPIYIFGDYNPLQQLLLLGYDIESILKYSIDIQIQTGFSQKVNKLHSFSGFFCNQFQKPHITSWSEKLFSSCTNGKIVLFLNSYTTDFLLLSRIINSVCLKSKNTFVIVLCYDSTFFSTEVDETFHSSLLNAIKEKVNFFTSHSFDILSTSHTLDNAIKEAVPRKPSCMLHRYGMKEKNVLNIPGKIDNSIPTVFPSFQSNYSKYSSDFLKIERKITQESNNIFIALKKNIETIIKHHEGSKELLVNIFSSLKINKSVALKSQQKLKGDYQVNLGVGVMKSSVNHLLEKYPKTKINPIPTVPNGVLNFSEPTVSIYSSIKSDITENITTFLKEWSLSKDLYDTNGVNILYLKDFHNSYCSLEIMNKMKEKSVSLEIMSKKTASSFSFLDQKKELSRLILVEKNPLDEFAFSFANISKEKIPKGEKVTIVLIGFEEENLLNKLDTLTFIEIKHKNSFFCRKNKKSYEGKVIIMTNGTFFSDLAKIYKDDITLSNWIFLEKEIEIINYNRKEGFFHLVDNETIPLDIEKAITNSLTY